MLTLSNTLFTASRRMKVLFLVRIAVLVAFLFAMATVVQAQTTPVDEKRLDAEDREKMLALLGLTSSNLAPVPTNYDEARANPYPLTDPLRSDDGHRVTDAKTWWQLRRPEIARHFLTEMYGQIPVDTPRITWESSPLTISDTGTTDRAFRIVGLVDNSAYPEANPRIELTLYLPTAAWAAFEKSPS